MTPLLALAVSAAAAPHVDAAGAPDRAVHARLDADATWGVGGQMFLGAQVHGSGYVAVWDTRRATGSVDFGLQAAYDDEATFLAPWTDRGTTSGATHRVQLVATLGHTFHMGPQRRVSLGLQAFAGWNHWRSDYTVVIPEADVDAHAVVSRDLFVSGAQVTLADRISDRVGVNLVLTAPFPTSSDYAIGVGSLGVGPTFYLR